MQHLNLKQLELKVNDTFEEDERITKNFEPSNDEHVVNRAHQNAKKFQSRGGHISFKGKEYKGQFLHNNQKQSDEEFLIERAVKSTIEMLYDKRLHDIYDSADEVWKD